MNLKTSKKSQIALNDSFWNQTFDKGRLKNFVLWFLLKHGEYKTVKLVEELKTLGFQYATKAGISLGIEDLMIPKRKNILIMEAEKLSINTIKEYKRNEITGVERFQRLIDTWHRTSERLKQEVIENFEATDILNPVYMMAFSGARGNISQVRQLVGMRGLMSNPQGQIIDFPIRSNFREGLTLTEYIISSYGARKGIVDTALRTANAGYLTRRLVDVAQHVIISNFDCGTKRGIFLTDMKEGNKIIYSLQNRLVGRVLARDVFNQHKTRIASRNTEISSDLSNTLATTCKKVFVRSSLTCQTRNLVCQLCYGWSLAQGNLVGIGEAVGVVAAQSIGEPGTQLTMRTFHTGGVFSGDVSDQIKAPYDGIVVYDNPIAGTLIRTPEGKIAFLTKNEGSVSIFSNILSQKNNEISLQIRSSEVTSSCIVDNDNAGRVLSNHTGTNKNVKKFKIPFYTLLFFKNGEKVLEKEVIAQISSINRQKNATDEAEFTINAELSGQFFSKLLNLKENKVGPKLKAGKFKIETQEKNKYVNTPIQGKSSKSSKSSPEIVIEQFNEDIVDTIYESWGWGYAWVLSGKIYQLPHTSNFFPIVGDFVNNKTYMNKNKLSLTSSFGNSFKLSIPLKKSFFNKKIIKKLRISKDITNILEYNQKQVYKPITKKDITFLKTELISLKLSKIIYKKFGYFIKLTKPTLPALREDPACMHGLGSLPAAWKRLPLTGSCMVADCQSDHAGSPTMQAASNHAAAAAIMQLPTSKTSVLSDDDTIFLLSSLDKNLLETNGSEDINIHNEKESHRDKNSFIYPSKWVSSFDVFLNWFPKRFYTKTGGLIFMEPIFFNTLLNSTNKIKENSVILSKIIDNAATMQVAVDNSGTSKNIYNKNLNSEFELTNVFENNISIKNYFKNKKIKNLSSIYRDTIIDSDFLFSFSYPYGISKENCLFVNHLVRNEHDNQTRYKVDKKNLYFFPTFIKRNLLINKVKQTTNKNKESLIEKQTFNNNLLSHSLNKSVLKDYSKSLIFEQYQTKEIGTVIIGTDKQSPTLSKNKKPSTLLTYGLNWKNNFKLNFNKFSSFKKQNLFGSTSFPLTPINSANSWRVNPFGEKNSLNHIIPTNKEVTHESDFSIKNDQKLETKHLQRIFYIPEFFYKFSLKKLGIKKSINIKNLISCNSIVDPEDSAAIIQLNRQGKFKKYYLKEGYLNAHISDFFKLKNYNIYEQLNISPFILGGVSSLRTNMQVAELFNPFGEDHPAGRLPSPTIQATAATMQVYSTPSGQEVLPKMFYPISKLNNMKFKKLSVYSKFYYNSFLNETKKENEPIFSFYKNLFNRNYNYDFLKKHQPFNLKLVKQLKKRNKILLNNFLYNIEELKTSKISFITNLNKEQQIQQSNNQNKLSKKIHFNSANSQKNKVSTNQTLSKITLKTFSKMMSFPYFLNKKSSNLLNKKLITLSDNIFSENDKQNINRKNKIKTSKTNNFSLFNYHFYSCFNKNKKKQIFLNKRSSNKETFVKKNLLTSVINKKKSGSLSAAAKVNQICSPYLKNQLKYSFYLLDTLNKKSNVENNYFYRILNINNFLSNSSLGFATQTLFYKKGFFYLGFFEQPKKIMVNIKTQVQKNKNFELSNTKEISSFQSMRVDFLSINNHITLNSFNSFSISYRVRTLQIWLKKAFYFKNSFFKTYKNVRYSFIKSTSCMEKTSASGSLFHAAASSNPLRDKTMLLQGVSSEAKTNPEFGLKTLYEKNLLNRITNKKKYKIYSQSNTKDYLNIKKISSLINLSVKPGWFYFTKNLSKFLLYNRNFIHPGKIVADDFIFDHSPIYLEVITLGKEFENSKPRNLGPSCMVDPLQLHGKDFRCRPCRQGLNHAAGRLPSPSIQAAAWSLPTMQAASYSEDKTHDSNYSSNIKTLRFIKTIKNNKCRFEPDNLKESFKAKKTKINSKNIENNNKGFFILIRKASEYKLHKDFQLKKEMHKLSNQTNLNNTKNLILQKSNFFSTKNYNQYIWTAETPLKVYNFNKVVEKRKTQPINLGIDTNVTACLDGRTGSQRPSSCMVDPFQRFDHAAVLLLKESIPNMQVDRNSLMRGSLSSPKMDNSASSKIKTIYTTFPQNEKKIIAPEKLDYAIGDGLTLDCMDGQAAAWSLPTMQAVSDHAAAAARHKPSSTAVQVQHRFQLFSFEVNRFDYSNENTIHLYNQYKTPFINKQKIASQILSKYPSSDLKIFSKIPFYSSLLMFKTKLFNSFQSEICNLPVKNNFSLSYPIADSQLSTMNLGISNKINLESTQDFLLEKRIKNVKLLKKISLSLNKQNSWGIPLMPITAKGSINLLPFIISYKAPYSMEFPFKYSIRFFNEQHNFTSFNKNFTLVDNLNFSNKVNSSLNLSKNLSQKTDTSWRNFVPKTNSSSSMDYLKKILNNYRLKKSKLRDLNNMNLVSHNIELGKDSSLTKKILFELNKKNKIKSILSTIFFCPIAEYSLGKNIEKSILYPNNIISTYPIQNTRLFISNQNFIYNKKFFSRKYKEKLSFISSKLGPAYLGHSHDNVNHGIKSMPYVLGSLNNFLDFSPKYKINNEVFLYKTEFESFIGNKISPLLPFVNSYNYCCFEGELIFKSLKSLIKQNNNSFIKQSSRNLLALSNGTIMQENYLKNKTNNKKNLNTNYNKIDQLKKNKIKSFDQQNLENELFSNKRLGDSCIILTKKDQLSFYLDSNFSFDNNRQISKSMDLTLPRYPVDRGLSLPAWTDRQLHGRCRPCRQSATMQLQVEGQQFKLSQDLNYKQIYRSLEDFKNKNRYLINETIIKFSNVTDQNSNLSSTYMVKPQADGSLPPKLEEDPACMDGLAAAWKRLPLTGSPTMQAVSDHGAAGSNSEKPKKNLMNFYKINKLPMGTSHQKNKLLLGEFLVYGDQISQSLSVTKAGQIIHINNKKVTLRHGQPIFVSPKAILHKYDTDFIEEQSPVITLSYQQLKTGDIIQGIPKVEQFFEARTTKRGRLFRDSLKNLLKGLFKRYSSKGQPSDQAVRQSFYKIQQIIVDGVQRVYRSQGVSIADKHLEVIVKQMTSKVRIIEGGQTGFFPGEIVDLNFIEQVNTLLMRKITYEPLVLGITKASLEVDSFLSAASFQQTTRVLSNAALSRKKDFLKGLKENVILGNLIPAGTGYLVYLD
jgi:hypothetical protein